MRYDGPMSNVIAQRELRNDNATVIERVVQGERFIVTRNGVPVAELRPVTVEPAPFVPRHVLETWVGLGPPVDAARFRADLDQVVDPYL